MKFFKCNICGNMVELIDDGGGELVCCGEVMEKLDPKENEEGNEKHLPVYELDRNILNVRVGSELHPMIDNHYIEFILIKYDNIVVKRNFKPNEEPIHTFILDETPDEIEIYEYCNVHGLWKVLHQK